MQDIPRDRAAPAAARRLLDEVAPTLAPEVAAEARLLLSEVVTNSVRHGRGDAVRVLVEVVGDEHLRCEVMDDGHGFTPRARARPATEAGGWGLHLVETLSHRWGVRQGSTHVWFELRRGA